jgi:hypothetical protein
MIQQFEATAFPAQSGDEDRLITASIEERTRRIDVLVKLDRVLAHAANQYDLAAEIVRHGWPHRSASRAD